MCACGCRAAVRPGWMGRATEVEVTRLFSPAAAATCLTMSCANLHRRRRAHVTSTD